ncbi:MAG: hypothetical protein ABJQ71_11505 [Roseibium sp.]
MPDAMPAALMQLAGPPTPEDVPLSAMTPSFVPQGGAPMQQTQELQPGRSAAPLRNAQAIGPEQLYMQQLQQKSGLGDLFKVAVPGKVQSV